MKRIYLGMNLPRTKPFYWTTARTIKIDEETEHKIQHWISSSAKLNKRSYRSPQEDSTAGPPKPEELTVAQVAAKFRVSHNVVYYWIRNDHLRARRSRPGGSL